jgi:hypothetical protein
MDLDSAEIIGKDTIAKEQVEVLSSESDEAKKQLKVLVHEAVRDFDKFKELVEILCDPRVPTGVAVWASCYFDFARDDYFSHSESVDYDTCAREVLLLRDLMNSKGACSSAGCIENVKPCYFWKRYNEGYYIHSSLEDDCEECSGE